MKIRIVVISFISILLTWMALSSAAYAYVKGIYITSTMALYPNRISYFVKRSKKVGINTFVMDFYHSSKRYRQSVAILKKNGIHYVARIVVFPYGAHDHQVNSAKYRDKIWRRIKGAVEMGAQEIQLDYIRYKRSRHSSSENARKIYRVIQDYRQRLKGTGVKLQIDIFGIATIKPSRHIGQDPVLFANSVDAICPMVYPSHYEPYRHHAVRPYSTVLESVSSLKKKLSVNHSHVKVYAYIELYNYRYPMSRATKIKYIQAQLQAAKDGGANGWYAWSAQNKYGLLFHILETYR